MGFLAPLTRLLSPRSWGVFDRARLGGVPLPLIGLNQLANVGAYTCFALSGRAVTMWSLIVREAFTRTQRLGVGCVFLGLLLLAFGRS